MSSLPRAHILVVDDSPLILSFIERVLCKNHKVEVTADSVTAKQLIQDVEFDLFIIDLLMPEVDGLALIKHIRAVRNDAPIIVVSQTQDIDQLISVLRTRVYDFLRKPLDARQLEQTVENALDYGLLKRRVKTLTRELSGYSPKWQPYIGPSPAMTQVWNTTRLYAEGSATECILITGETGTGKELIARALHRWSSRHDGPFISVNCSLLDGQLTNAELFGVGRRVATGVEAYAGKFEAAHGGSLFLDEIADLPLESQSKLLRVLQTGTLTRVGSNKEFVVDTRLIAATNRSLSQCIKRGLFREDLYYRLNVLPIHLPPLRERREDISGLVAYFIAKHAKRLNSNPPPVIEPQLLETLKNYSWPGNVRQLENVIVRMLVTGAISIFEQTNTEIRLQPGTSPRTILVSNKTWADIEKEILKIYLQDCDSRIHQIAKRLRISKSTVYYKLKKYDLDPQTGDQDRKGHDLEK